MLDGILVNDDQAAFSRGITVDAIGRADEPRQHHPADQSADMRGVVRAGTDCARRREKAFLGQGGFTLIAIAAMLSTASAINATLYGSARLSYCIAADGELPASLERKVWGEPVFSIHGNQACL